MQRGECRLNALVLAFGDQTGEHLAEIRMASAGVDVLPAVGRKKGGLDRRHLVRLHCSTAIRGEIASIGCRLRLQNSVHCGDQLDEIVDCPVALFGRQRGIVPSELELVEERVLTLLFPVIEKYIPEQLRQLGVGSMLWR